MNEMRALLSWGRGKYCQLDWTPTVVVAGPQHYLFLIGLVGVGLPAPSSARMRLHKDIRTVSTWFPILPSGFRGIGFSIGRWFWWAPSRGYPNWYQIIAHKSTQCWILYFSHSHPLLSSYYPSQSSCFCWSGRKAGAALSIVDTTLSSAHPRKEWTWGSISRTCDPSDSLLQPLS